MTSAMTTPPLRARLGAWIESPQTQNVLIALIVFNAVILGVPKRASPSWTRGARR